EQVWGYTDEAHLPRLIFVNKMERENANFQQTLAQAREAFGNAIIALELPIGAAASYSGHVDLLSRTAYGTNGEQTSVPSDLADTVEEMRQALVEKIAETDDELIERFLGDEEITDDELKAALRKAVAAGDIVPVLAGSATKAAGVTPLLDAMV